MIGKAVALAFAVGLVIGGVLGVASVFGYYLFLY